MIDREALGISNELPDVLGEGFSPSARVMYENAEYRQRYSELLSGFLAGARFGVRKRTYYANHWPVSDVEAISPAVLIVGRAAPAPWAENLDSRGFPVDLAIESAARKDMGWARYKWESPFMRWTLEVVARLAELGEAFRNPNVAPHLDVTWTELYKVARPKANHLGDPTYSQKLMQRRLGLRELIRLEVELLQPKLVLVLTQVYDRELQTVRSDDSWFTAVFGECETASPPARGPAPWVYKFGNVPALVCAHPESAKRRGVRKAEFIDAVLTSARRI